MLRRSLVLAAAVPALVLACSGKAVVEPAARTTKTAELFLDKCEETLPDDGGQPGLEMVYICLPAEDICGERTDPLIQEALGHQVEKANECGKTIELADVPCGPDLNAVQCCYAVHIRKQDPCF